MAGEVRAELREGTRAAGAGTRANRPEHARQARSLADTERTQTRNAHGELALWLPCVLPAKIRLGEAEAICRSHSDAARLKSAASVRLRRMGVANCPASPRREGF